MSKALKSFASSPAQDAEEVAAIFEELKTDGPRGVASLASALMEHLIEGAIKYRMVKLTSDEERDLFQGTAPLATLSARIRVAYAMGIIGTKVRRDLNLLREIRNALVHTRRRVTFETKEVAELCATFIGGKDIGKFRELAPREQFIQVTQMLLKYLTSKIGRFPRGMEGMFLKGLDEYNSDDLNARTKHGSLGKR
jgi:hypothetical protein